jgi:hypothetical protein
MAKVVLSDQLNVLVNGIDLSTHVAAITVTVSAEERDSSNFNSNYRERITGLKDGSVSISFHSDYASQSVNATIGPLLASYATVVASGTLGGIAAGMVVVLVAQVPLTYTAALVEGT